MLPESRQGSSAVPFRPPSPRIFRAAFRSLFNRSLGAPKFTTALHSLPLSPTSRHDSNRTFRLVKKKMHGFKRFLWESKTPQRQLVGTTTGGVSWDGIVEGLMSDSRSTLCGISLIS